MSGMCVFPPHMEFFEIGYFLNDWLSLCICDGFIVFGFQGISPYDIKLEIGASHSTQDHTVIFTKFKHTLRYFYYTIVCSYAVYGKL
jgi:hypothetical protein